MQTYGIPVAIYAAHYLKRITIYAAHYLKRMHTSLIAMQTKAKCPKHCVRHADSSLQKLCPLSHYLKRVHTSLIGRLRPNAANTVFATQTQAKCRKTVSLHSVGLCQLTQHRLHNVISSIISHGPKVLMVFVFSFLCLCFGTHCEA